MKQHLKQAHAGQDEKMRTLMKEFVKLETATNQLYEAVEKGLLLIDDMLRIRAQKLISRRNAVLFEVAGSTHQRASCGLLTARHLDFFSMTLRARVLDRTAGFLKRYSREFVSAISFDGKRVVIRGKKAALIETVAQKKGTTCVPSFTTNWLLDLGSNQGPTD